MGGRELLEVTWTVGGKGQVGGTWTEGGRELLEVTWTVGGNIGQVGGHGLGVHVGEDR